MMFGFIVWSIVAIVYVVIGISCRKSKEPVGFFTFVKAPTVKNIEKYNRAVSMLWFVAAVLLEIIGVPFLFFEQDSPIFIFMAPAVMILVIIMMIVYIRIEAKYKN